MNATDPTSFVPKATVAQNVIPILVAIPMLAGQRLHHARRWLAGDDLPARHHP